MKKLIMLSAALLLVAAALPGCKASGEVDPDGATNVGVAQ
jgi:hypothetical protein